MTTRMATGECSCCIIVSDTQYSSTSTFLWSVLCVVIVTHNILPSQNTCGGFRKPVLRSVLLVSTWDIKT